MRGELSKSRYCKGVRYPKILWLDEHKPEMVNEYIQLLEDGSKCKTEAIFLYDDRFCSVDILLNGGNYQYYILFKSGNPDNRVFIKKINNQYVRQGNINLQGLFEMEYYTSNCGSFY